MNLTSRRKPRHSLTSDQGGWDEVNDKDLKSKWLLSACNEHLHDQKLRPVIENDPFIASRSVKEFLSPSLS